jgi:hypothetical protein
MGLGTKAGPEKIVLTAHALLKSGHIASTEDAINGFNSVTRQAILDAASHIWPEATNMLNKLHGQPAIAFYFYRDNNNNKKLKTILCTEGTRMGCPLGSLGFDMAEHFYIFRHLQTEFDHVIIRALADDLCPFFAPPTGDEDWETYDELANLGLFRNLAKSKMVLPPGAPDPLTHPRGPHHTILYPANSAHPPPPRQSPPHPLE